MRGVQFFTNYQGQKTAALIDLKEHHEFWQDVIAEIDEPTDFQFLINENGEKIAVLLEFDKHDDLWEDVYDGLLCENREEDTGVLWENFKLELESQRSINV
jgi:hypothetical protein